MAGTGGGKGMRAGRIPWHRVAGGVCAVVFALLLAVRLDLLATDPPARPLSALQREAFADRETWLKVLQNGNKIGYAHRRLSGSAEGYRFEETLVLRLMTMGTLQDLSLRTRGTLRPDTSLADFAMEIRSPLFVYAARGEVAGRELILRIGAGKEETVTRISLDRKPYLSNGLLDAVWLADMRPGDTRTFHVFDPGVLGQRPVRVTVLSEEEVTAMGSLQKARKIGVEFAGIRQHAWLGADGNLLRAEGFLGLTLEQATAYDARAGWGDAAGVDVTEAVSVRANRTLDRAADIAWIRYRLGGLENAHLAIDGGRQLLRRDILTVTREPWPPAAPTAAPDRNDLQAALRPSAFVQSDHALIRKKVQEIVEHSDTPADKARKIVSWVHDHIEKRPVLSVPSAVDTLIRRTGDCNEHAVLVAALARAAGIPAWVEAGLAYQEGRFYYHAWNILYLEGWVTADAVFGQVPADVTHIRLVRGETRDHLDLLAVVGRITVEILETGA